MNTTIKVTKNEKYIIENTAKKNGYTVSGFILKSLDENMPLNIIPVFDKREDRNKLKIGVVLTKKLNNKIDDNVKILSTEFKRVYRWEIILKCVLLECEK